MNLPEEYLTYLRGGHELFGELKAEDFDRYFELCPEEEIEEWNADYEIDKYAPEFTVFGTNGGGELYVFNKEGAVFELPAIGMATEAALKIAESWGEFRSRIVDGGIA